MQKKLEFINANSDVFSFIVYFGEKYEKYVNEQFVEMKLYESKNMFEKVYAFGNKFFGVFFKNPLGFHTFIETENIELMNYIRDLKFIFFNPDDNFDEIHFFELLTKEDIEKLTFANEVSVFNLDAFDNKYTSFYKLKDGRIFIMFPDKTGQLFANKNELELYEKMINSF